ncbi:MAG: BlaI/MecI/CopY family transcriptional regulator [Verrucomicrobiota bacterium]
MNCKKQKPTEAQLEILHVLWTQGPRTVKQVWEEQGQKTGYTGILKLMQIMHEKGLVNRDESARSHIYSADHNQKQTARQLLGELQDKVFGGSTSKLVLSALSENPTSPEELCEIRKLIDKLENTGKKK